MKAKGERQRHNVQGKHDGAMRAMRAMRAMKYEQEITRSGELMFPWPSG